MKDTHALKRARQRLGLFGDAASVAQQLHKLCELGERITARQAKDFGAPSTHLGASYYLIKHNGRRYILVVTDADPPHFITVLRVRFSRTAQRRRRRM